MKQEEYYDRMFIQSVGKMIWDIPEGDIIYPTGYVEKKKEQYNKEVETKIESICGPGAYNRYLELNKKYSNE